VENICVGKQAWIPIKIENIEELKQRLVVDPKYAVVDIARKLGIIVERGL